MIKWAGYGKLLKLSFFGLLINFFILFVGSSVNATLQVVGLDKYPSSVDSNYKLGFLKGGGLLTDYLGQSKSIIAFDNSSFVWWTPDGKLYFYDTDSLQGYFGEFWSCSVITGVDGMPGNCSSNSIGGDFGELFKGFFSKVKAGDYVYYGFTPYYNNSSANGSSRGHFVDVCWSSFEIGNSLCFRRGYCYSSNAHGCSANYGSLVNSLNYTGLTFSNLPYSNIGYAPGTNGYMGNYQGSQGGSSEGYVDGFLTGSVFQQKCTVGYAKNYAENMGMSKYLCYGGLPIDSTGIVLPVSGTGASVFEIYSNSSNGQNFQDWFLYWNNIYTHRFTYDSSVWSGTPAPLSSYFGFVNQYGPSFTARDIQDYCRIIVNNMSNDSSRHGNSSWCPSFGGNGNAPGGGGGGSWDDDTGTGGSSSISYDVSVNWDGVGNHSGNDVKTPSAYIQDFFNKAREVVPTNFNDIGGGFLPTYIITFLCAIILFRFIRH